MTQSPAFEVIPAIDIIDGKVVRLVQGNYDKVTQYSTDPVDIAKSFEDAGATRIHIVDLDGAKSGRVENGESIANIRNAVNCTLELGGGIRTINTAKEWLNIGVDQLILGSLIVKDKAQAFKIIQEFPHKVIVGLDMLDGKIAVEGWLEKSDESVSDLLKELESLHVASIIYTNIKHDGMMIGPDIAGLSSMATLTKLPLIASGGVRNGDDIEAVSQLPSVAGCIIGRAFLSGSLDLNVISQKSK